MAVVEVLLHPKLLLLLLLAEAVLVIEAEAIQDWFLVWVPFYIHDTLVATAFLTWIPRAYTRSKLERLAYTVLLLGKMCFDVMLPYSLNHAGQRLSYLAAVLPLTVVVGAAAFLTLRDIFRDEAAVNGSR
jgi:hypothetical protein